MLFQFGFYSSLLLIFFVHGSVYAILLWRKSILNDSVADKWLSAFLLLSVLYIAPWMLGFAGWYDTRPYREFLFYIPFQHLFFIGPVIYCYVQAVLNPQFRFHRKLLWHFLPGLLYLVYSVVVVVTDKLVLHEAYFLANGEDPDFDLWYQLSGFISMIIYFILSIQYYNSYRKLLVQVVSYAEAVSFRWIRNFLFAVLAILVIRFILFCIGLVVDLGYWDTWWYFLAFALCFYYIAINGYANSVETKVAFQTEAFTSRPAILLTYPGDNNPVTEDAEVIELDSASPSEPQPDAALAEWSRKVLAAVVEERLFEAPELTLTDLARHLGTHPALISRAVNRGFAMNFNDFINYHRVQAVLEKLRAGEQQRQTLLGIAYDCGFNSKATFNRAFKKATGRNPKDWQPGQS